MGCGRAIAAEFLGMKKDYTPCRFASGLFCRRCGMLAAPGAQRTRVCVDSCLVRSTRGGPHCYKKNRETFSLILVHSGCENIRLRPATRQWARFDPASPCSLSFLGTVCLSLTSVTPFALLCYCAASLSPPKLGHPA